jgi:NTE family protein
MDRLRAFWNYPPLRSRDENHLGHLYGWMGAIRTRLLGSAGHFHPRLPSMNLFRFRSLYDLTPMKERLTSLIDFGRLNCGEMRVSIAAADIETGEPVVFDSHHESIGMHHLMASCGFLPEFAPIEVGGRLLGDGACR